MKALVVIALAACAPTPQPAGAPAPPQPPAAARPVVASTRAANPPAMFAPPATGADATHGFRLHKFMQEIGREADIYVVTPDGTIEASSSFAFRDRGWTVPLSARVELGSDGSLISYEIWGDTSRLSYIDERVRLRSDGAYDITRDGKRERVVAAPGSVVASGYAPMLVQELVLQTWRARGKPSAMPVLEGGVLAISSRGTETYDGPAGKLALEHVAIGGLVWGIEDAWIDDKGGLAAVITRDAEFDHFEAAQGKYLSILPQLAKAAGTDGVARLADAAKSVETETHGQIALVGATLIDGVHPSIANAVVIIDGDKIVAAGPHDKVAIPSGATTIDATGKFLVPGLWDMHAHVEQVEQGGAYLAAGVTTVRDMGNVMDFIVGVRDAIDAGKGLGPRILVNGLVDGEGPGALGTLRIKTREDIPKVVDQLKALGCQEVKIYSSVSPALVAPIAQYAHAHGMRVVGHVPNGMTSQQAVEAGYDAISHLHFLFDAAVEPKGLTGEDWRIFHSAIDLKTPAFEKLFATLVAHHTVIDDTVSLYEQGAFPADEIAKREPGLATLPRELAVLFPPPPPKDVELDAKVFAKNLELIKIMHEHHISFVAGTDINVPGHSLHRELELYVQAGFTPLEALQAATIVPARYMHRDKELGTIEAGKRADLVILTADPLADIHNIRKIDRVVARGKVYDARALWKLVGFGALR
jgi:imidazolonepropionase-like amidohydrolase